MRSRKILLRAGAAASTLGIVLASGAGMLLFASPAAADVTGYQTGYAYHQGLANGSGGVLESNGDTAVTAVPTNTALSATDASGNGLTDGTTNATPVTTSVAPTAQAATPSAAPANTTAAPATTQTAGVTFADVATPIAWAAVIIAVLALIGAGINAAYRASSDADVESHRRTITYRRNAF